jgi:hypothetical protein
VGAPVARLARYAARARQVNVLVASPIAADKQKRPSPVSGDGRSRFTIQLGSSPAGRPAYDAERNANRDEADGQPDRHSRSMANPARISKYNYLANTIIFAYARPGQPQPAGA